MSYSGGYDPTCNGSGASVNLSDYMYGVHSFVAPYDAYVVATLETPNPVCCTVEDMYLLLYCDPFNAATPLASLRAGDDDGGTSFNSAFLPEDEIMVAGGNTYYFVATHFTSITPPYTGPAVPYTITYSFEPIAEVPLSNWALGIGILLILTAAIIRFRRFS